MAESLAHKFGQIIGDLLELTVQPSLEAFAKDNHLYLDKKGNRKSRSGKKVSWLDNYDNKHDLDFVLERGGSDDSIGTPVAFVEIAWRRYTRHSRNKAQEIQGAILPLAEKFRNSSPFKGVVLAGEFTTAAIMQLKSMGFSVLYFPYSTIVDAFAKVGLNAYFDEETTEAAFKEKIDKFYGLTNPSDIATELVNLNQSHFRDFLSELQNAITRRVEYIWVLPLHGNRHQITSIHEAISFLTDYKEQKTKMPFHKYEIVVKFNNGDRIEATFQGKSDAVDFLAKYL